jgi:hypothetical protein
MKGGEAMTKDTFKCEAYWDRYDYILRATRNGYQYSSITLDNLEQLEAVGKAALEYVAKCRADTGHQQART